MINSLIVNLKKVRKWGIRGVIDYLSRISKNRRTVKKLAKYFDPALVPTRGITLIGEMRRSYGLSKTMRDFAYSLKDAGIPFQAYDMSEESEIPECDVEGILTPLPEFKLNKYDHVVQMFFTPCLQRLGLKMHNIYFWEFEDGMLKSHPDLRLCSSLIAMSDFNYGYFKKEFGSKATVSKILYPFRFEDDITEEEVDRARERFGIGKDAFSVFYNFDLKSGIGRKNPAALLKAFAQAFDTTPEALLVLKVSGTKAKPHDFERVKALAVELGIGAKTLFVTDYLPQRELYALTKACSVYCSLHRGEGLGLGIAEAMSLGVPAVITNWSAPLEFCNSSNSILVDTQIVPAQEEEKDHLFYRWVQRWAEPDITSAAKALRKLYENPDLRRELGERGKKSIREHFTIESFRRSVDDFLSRT